MKTNHIEIFSCRQKNKSHNFSTSAYLSFAFFFFMLCSGCKKNIDEIRFQNKPGNINNSSLSVKPNIILILGDDVGYEIPTYTGGQSYSTPNLDAFAKGSMQFTQSHATPLCCPSRVELLTGKYNFRNYTGWGTFPVGDKTFANVLHDAGYTTCLSGKWQFDGADEIIKSAGFDTYCINGASENGIYRNGSRIRGKWYKDPHIYQNGKLLPDSLYEGKYGQDVFRDFMFNFIDNNKNKKSPFFIFWTPNLCHKPFAPTPDDPEFKTWNSDKPEEPGDTVYFPSMVRYMDKMVGQLLQKLQSNGLQNNTIIIFVGDNGTSPEIFSNYKGQLIKGAKGKTIETGIHVPLIINYPGITVPGSINNDLIDFCDFWPTLLGLAKVSFLAADNPNIDGISFSPQIHGNSGNVRSWSFCYYQPHPESSDPNPTERWVKNATYKRYDSTADPKKKGLYNFLKNDKETAAIPYYQMTSYQQTLNAKFQHVLDSLK